MNKSELVLNIESRQFMNVKSLNKNRFEHSSTSIGKNVYAFGGRDEFRTKLDDIEVMEVLAEHNQATWTAIVIENFPCNTCSIAYPLSPTTFILLTDS